MDLLVIVGFDNLFVQVSPSFERLLGWKNEEVLGKSFMDFLHPNDRAASAKEAQSNVEGKNAVRFENRYRCKNGAYRWISWNSHPLVEKQIVIGIGRDITEQKKAEQALKQSEEQARHRAEELQKLMDIIPAAVWVSNDLEMQSHCWKPDS